MFELAIDHYQECVGLITEYVGGDEESESQAHDYHPDLKAQKAGCLNNIALCYKNM